MRKYHYHENVCKANKYRSLNPVVYEKLDPEDETELFHKVRMGCNLLDTGQCNLDPEECLVFQSAPETIDRKKEWWLRTEKL